MPKLVDRSTPEWFWKNVDTVSSLKGCWLWTGHKRQGYGIFKTRVNGKYRNIRVHRFVFAFACGGALPDELFVCHHCDVPACCRPDHLFLGNNKDNSSDMARKGRSTKGRPVKTMGEKNPSAKLTWSQVKKIRARYKAGEMQILLASEYEVSQAVISAIVLNKIWVQK